MLKSAQDGPRRKHSVGASFLRDAPVVTVGWKVLLNFSKVGGKGTKQCDVLCLLTVVMGDSKYLQQHDAHVCFLLCALVVRRGQGHPERAVWLSDAECSHVFRGHVMDHLQRFFAILQKNKAVLRSTVTTQYWNRRGMAFLCIQSSKYVLCAWTLKSSRNVSTYELLTKLVGNKGMGLDCLPPQFR